MQNDQWSFLGFNRAGACVQGPAYPARLYAGPPNNVAYDRLLHRGGTRQPGAGTAAGICDGTPAPVRYVAI